MRTTCYTKDNVKVELVNTGAVLDAGYLRLFLEDLVANQGANYLSFFPVDAPDEEVNQAILMVMEVAHDRILAGKDIRKLCMRLSWISPDWLKDIDECPVCEGSGCSVCGRTGKIRLAPLSAYVCDDDDGRESHGVLTEMRLALPAHEFEEERLL